MHIAQQPASKYLKQHSSHFHLQRELRWRSREPVDLNEHATYPDAAILQILGRQNTGDHACDRCKQGAGPFDECVSFPPIDKRLPRPPNDPLFDGVCANCFWGGHNSGCSLRVGGRKFFHRSFSVLLNPLQNPLPLVLALRPYSKATLTDILISVETITCLIRRAVKTRSMLCKA